MKIIDLTFPCVKSFFWVYSSWEPPCWQRRLSRASTSPLLAMLVALPWNRPSFPAPFPWSSSKTLVSTHKTSVHTLFGNEPKRIFGSLTEIPCQSPVCSVQPEGTNRVLFPRQQSGKPTFPAAQKMGSIKDLIYKCLEKQSGNSPLCLFHWRLYS